MACPFACAFLASGVQNNVNHWFACFRIVFREDISCNLNQVAVELAFVPLGEDAVKLFRAYVQHVFQQVVGFADQLHVTILNAVMNHLHVVASAVRSDVCAASVVADFSGNRCQNRLNQLVRGFLTARHDGRAFQRAFFAARNARADKADALLFKRFAAALRVRE